MSVNPINLTLNEAEALLIALGDVQNELAPLEKREKEIKAALKAWAEANRQLFGTDNSLGLEHGLLTYSRRMEAVLGEGYDPAVLAKKRPLWLKPDGTAIRRDLAKKPELAELLEKAHIALEEKEVFTVKAK